MTVLRRVLLGVLVVILVVTVGVGIFATSMVRAPWPATGGEVELPSLTAPVTVLRDERGVPHIYADSTADLMRAQGFTAASDRFFEMDLRRHVTAGRLAELVGEAGLETDKVIRTLGWRRVAEAELPTLAVTTRRMLDAYAEGVNDYLAAHPDPRSIALEYTILGIRNSGYRPERWSALDSLAWLKAMAWDLRSDYSDELTRARLAGTIRKSQLELLYPPYPYDTNKPILSRADWVGAVTRPVSESGPVPVATADYAAAMERTSRALDAIPALLGEGEGIGSNSWVVSGAKSSTGQPLLANDPHLGVSIPGIWTQVGLHCRSLSAECPFDTSGFAFAGMPGVVIGHNQSIAWGFTNLAPDVSDFYLEKINGDLVEVDGRQVPLELRSETIKVAGGDDVTITVRATKHGPIVSDVIESVAAAGRATLVDGERATRQYDVALAWTGLLPGKTADSIYQLNVAQNFEDFRAAARNFAVPSQNLLYADTAGHIGYQAPGLVPVRTSAVSGSPPGYWPAPGWDSTYDWRGFVPFEAMPFAFDPAEGFIVAANQAVTSVRRPFLTSEWDYGFRSQRIRDEIERLGTMTPQAMVDLQMDSRNGFAPTLVKELMAIDLSADDFTRSAQDLLEDWDYTQPADKSRASASAAYFNAVWRNILRYTFEELPEDLSPEGGSRWMVAVTGLLRDPTNDWWDDRNTRGVVEGAPEILRKAMVEARLDLTEQLGKDPATWRWGRLHSLTFEHQVLGGDTVPAYVRQVFNRGPIPLPGGSSIVNANGWDASYGDPETAQAYRVDWGPSMRMVIDLGSLDASRWVNQTGQSGHPYNDHYTDQMDAWELGGTFPWPHSVEAVKAAAAAQQTLVPAATP